MKLAFFAEVVAALVLTHPPSSSASSHDVVAEEIAAESADRLLMARLSQNRTDSAEISNASKVCVDISAWYTSFSAVPPWRVFSQFYQDSVLDSLFSPDWLGTTSKSFVEFGFSAKDWGPYVRAGTGPNTQYLKFRKGWSGLLLDGGNQNLGINLHKEFLTEQNLGTVFEKYGVPLDVDYVSIDIDSCDLQLFRALITTTPYRPKVVTVEYNQEYTCGESRANKCTIGSGPTFERYRWAGDNLYGSSLLAVSRVADENGYSLVWVAKHDAVFVKKSLLCPGSLIQFKRHCPGNTGVRARSVSRPAEPWEFQKWVEDYPGSLTP
jgi:hypothetical protein